jgi:hypothetical protein
VKYELDIQDVELLLECLKAQEPNYMDTSAKSVAIYQRIEQVKKKLTDNENEPKN